MANESAYKRSYIRQIHKGELLGTVFGYAKPVPESIDQCWAVVHDDEYTNGGRGPILTLDRVFCRRERAEAELDNLWIRHEGHPRKKD